MRWTRRRKNARAYIAFSVRFMQVQLGIGERSPSGSKDELPSMRRKKRGNEKILN